MTTWLMDLHGVVVVCRQPYLLHDAPSHGIVRHPKRALAQGSHRLKSINSLIGHCHPLRVLCLVTLDLGDTVVVCRQPYLLHDAPSHGIVRHPKRALAQGSHRLKSINSLIGHCLPMKALRSVNHSRKSTQYKIGLYHHHHQPNAHCLKHFGEVPAHFVAPHPSQLSPRSEYSVISPAAVQTWALTFPPLPSSLLHRSRCVNRTTL